MKILLVLFPIGNKIAGTGCCRQVNIFVSRLFQGCLSTHIGGQIQHTRRSYWNQTKNSILVMSASVQSSGILETRLLMKNRVSR